MLEFSFEIINEHNIAIEYKYGSEYFTFNLFNKYGAWTLHPFQGVLLQNKEMCRLVVADLLKNKEFHIMLVKSDIPLSSIRTSIDLAADQGRGDNRLQDDDYADDSDDLQQLIENHSLDDIIEKEKRLCGERIQLYKDILQRMFIEGYGPGDDDFAKIQSIVRAYGETLDKLNALSDSGYGGGSRRRF